MAAPRQIPEDMKNAFTVNGKIPIYDWYINGVVPINAVKWSNAYLESFISRFTIEKIRNGKTGGGNISRSCEISFAGI